MIYLYVHALKNNNRLSGQVSIRQMSTVMMLRHGWLALATTAHELLTSTIVYLKEDLDCSLQDNGYPHIRPPHAVSPLWFTETAGVPLDHSEGTLLPWWWETLHLVCLSSITCWQMMYGTFNIISYLYIRVEGSCPSSGIILESFKIFYNTEITVIIFGESPTCKMVI